MTSTDSEIVAKAAIGWKLDEEQRKELLQQFPPRFRNAVADHVTLESGAAPHARLPEAVTGEIVGCTDDGKGVEAMIVAIDGGLERPDGGTWHITWSLEPGREAKESNDVIARLGWKKFDLPMPVRLVPARFE